MNALDTLSEADGARSVPATARRVRIRSATADDYAAIMSVHKRNGLAVRTEEEWRHLWSHMTWLQCPESWPRGWLLEDSAGQVVGSLANIPQDYFWNGQRLVAASASQWAVDAEHRSHAVWLAAKFIQQRSADLLLNTTANEAAGRVFAELRAEKPPTPSCGEVRFWVVNHRRVAAAKLRALRIPVAGFIGRIAGDGLGMLDWKLRRSRRPPGIEARILGTFDARFDELWRRLSKTRNRLLAVRDRQALAWRFGNAARRGAVTILAAEATGELVGYAVAIRIDDQARQLRRWRIADMQADEDICSPDACAFLIMSAIEAARRDDVDTVEVVGQSSEKLAALERLSPRLRRQMVWPYYYKAAKQELAASLRDASAWDPSLLDGDATLF